MYLHKNGCKYYQKIFEVAYLRTKAAIESEKKTTQNPTVNTICNYTGVDVIDDIKQLLIYAQDIEKHIENEGDVLKNLINNIHKIMYTEKNIQMTDSKMVEVMQFVQGLPALYNKYKSLTSILKETITIITADDQKQKDATILEQRYQSIYNTLTDIYQKNVALATQLRKTIASIAKEEEMIKKEEELLTDFDKNMMSWF
ncbi:MAG: hypothetical protein ACP5N1_06130 [Candidatus Woesearchaeota archaeon]